ncbi:MULTISPECIES: hypothetical protein [Streptomyces]|uniref:Uncharacterized protein n=1 Tax=Streptomyces canarius TaxID=285453 RepID=A0ABQ3DBN4_9ACTN|nr:hypothetical protein [Streptomyces canarius]GHA74919.1 hypothetical protein GCM10010345_91550 [Streptomyces canarius]
MPNRPRLEEALDFLRADLASGHSEMTQWTTRGAWLAFMRFGRRRFDAAPTPDSDGLLFQYGTYAFSGRSMFTVDLTRQFDVTDEDGEHDHYVQVHYSPSNMTASLPRRTRAASPVRSRFGLT